MGGTELHIQIAARVMDFPKKRGQSEVEHTKRRGKKIAVINQEAADQYQNVGCVP